MSFICWCPDIAFTLKTGSISTKHLPKSHLFEILFMTSFKFYGYTEKFWNKLRPESVPETANYVLNDSAAECVWFLIYKSPVVVMS